MFRERPSRIPGGFVWSAIRATGETARVLPDGCMDLLWDGQSVFIAGADTRAQVLSMDRPSSMTGLRFAPGFAPRVLGLPADELTDQRVPLDSVWSAGEVRRITEILAASPKPGRTLERIALDHSPPPDDGAGLIDDVVALANAGCNTTAIARRVGLSTRQLQRRSTAAFGYGTKTLGRILRMQQALALIRGGDRAVDSAVRAGYADQSHLSREVKDLAGVSLTQLTR
jgi:AraC-like DNA-binding protein